MSEMVQKRHIRNSGGIVIANDGMFQKGPDDEKHESPTKRLIQHKDSTFKHKKVMQDQIQRSNYSLTYCPSPGKSYVIEPHGGEINYALAAKSPKKFYREVFNQDITKHKVSPNKQMTIKREN